MNKDKIQFLIETDTIVNHLMHSDENTKSFLEQAMIRGLCFTTVLNASELYFAANSNSEKECIDSVLKALKVLGVNARYSLSIADFVNKVATPRDAMICSIAMNNNLPILTIDKERYIKSGLEIISPKEF